jgi:hypothetical protein
MLGAKAGIAMPAPATAPHLGSSRRLLFIELLEKNQRESDLAVQIKLRSGLRDPDSTFKFPEVKAATK